MSGGDQFILGEGVANGKMTTYLLENNISSIRDSFVGTTTERYLGGGVYGKAFDYYNSNLIFLGYPNYGYNGWPDNQPLDGLVKPYWYRSYFPVGWTNWGSTIYGSDGTTESQRPWNITPNNFGKSISVGTMPQYVYKSEYFTFTQPLDSPMPSKYSGSRVCAIGGKNFVKVLIADGNLTSQTNVVWNNLSFNFMGPTSGSFGDSVCISPRYSTDGKPLTLAIGDSLSREVSIFTYTYFTDMNGQGSTDMWSNVFLGGFWRGIGSITRTDLPGFGGVVQLNDSGNILVVSGGADCRIYKRVGDENWEQMGQTLTGSYARLNSTGDVVAVTAPSAVGGQTRLYYWPI